MEFITNNLNIFYLKCENKEHIKVVSKLHIKLLPESILSQFGYLFLSKFYYPILTKYNLIDVYVYRYGNEYVGFISNTNYPYTFIREGMKKGFSKILGVMSMSILRKPVRLFLLLDFIIKSKKDVLLETLQNKYGNKMGEFLSFGVLENYRKCVDPIDDITIPHVLMRLMITHFKANNIHYCLLRIRKTNERAIKFYHKYGVVIIPSNNLNQVVIIIETPN
jgi:ribosomal protein S18 acetylase RimI-like enzyme